ncbi:hypothetical protein DFH07DRAFT_55648 [Mycena maculata]|uniref:Transmembrane protein n=1 Tax=Mycena maculata TaxID=230809 RepID=A0AAD7IGS0_9AGAR|nr:hypothetical protein DFH07DRAFT_55648 [Mycena maculata]
MSRAWTVATGTVIISVASTCITGLYAAFAGKRHANFAAASAFNSAVTTATFFSIREYAVGPTIAVAVGYSRRRRGIVEENDAVPDHLSWSRLRRHNLLDSGLSGAATGGMLRGVTAGRRTVVPAALTAGLACVLLQAAYNELGIQRIKYVGKHSPQLETSLVPVETTTPVKQSLTTRILGTLGVKQLSDEELLVKLRRQRETHLEKIRELEGELDEDKTRND